MKTRAVEGPGKKSMQLRVSIFLLNLMKTKKGSTLDRQFKKSTFNLQFSVGGQKQSLHLICDLVLGSATEFCGSTSIYLPIKP